MHNSAGVSGIERVRNLDPQFQQLFNFEGMALDLVFEGCAVQILHGDECLALLLADVIDGADILMVQSGRRLRFALEAGERLRVSGNFIGEELERYKTVQPCVLGLVHNTHAPTADLLDNPVVRDGLADHGVVQW